MKKVGIIGAGASGLVCAIQAVSKDVYKRQVYYYAFWFFFFI